MNAARKLALIKLGAEELAGLLLEFAQDDDRLSARIDWLLASQHDKLVLTRSKIVALQDDNSPINWRDAGKFESSLEDFLDEINTLNPSPETGLRLVADFFRADISILERCESDSTGYIFYGSGAKLFAKFAKDCNDKALVIELLCDLLEGDLCTFAAASLNRAPPSFQRPTCNCFLTSCKKRLNYTISRRCLLSWQSR